jgi:hypothetical protein
VFRLASVAVAVFCLFAEGRVLLAGAARGPPQLPPAYITMLFCLLLRHAVPFAIHAAAAVPAALRRCLPYHVGYGADALQEPDLYHRPAGAPIFFCLYLRAFYLHIHPTCSLCLPSFYLTTAALTCLLCTLSCAPPHLVPACLAVSLHSSHGRFGCLPSLFYLRYADHWHTALSAILLLRCHYALCLCGAGDARGLTKTGLFFSDVCWTLVCMRRTFCYLC